MSNDKHTPLPWKFRRTATGAVIEAVEGPGSGCVLASLEDVVTETPTSEAEPNAAFIVRACNSHEALVEALELCLADGVSKNAAPNGLGWAAIGKARNALKLAKGA